jgi:cytosine/adenosine deaminase-related metal-dependent hydrolase
MRLGSGIMPFRRLRRAGVPICLGTDEAVSDDSHNLWGAIKAAGIMHTLTDPDYAEWPRAAEILECVWEGGNQVMRRSRRMGRLEVGAAADIALLDRSADAFTPLHDIRRQLVLCESGSSVRHTIVDGRLVVQEGRITLIDEAELKREIRSLEPMVRAGVASLRDSAAGLEPFYREMVQRAAARDVGFTRWVGR